MTEEVGTVFFGRRQVKSQRAPSRRLVAERLEAREMLAGDVSAVIRGGSLQLVGDSQDNEITLSVNDGGDLVLTGQSATTINGSTDPFTVLSGSSTLRRNLNIRLLNGDDIVRLNGFLVANAMTVSTGRGDDVVEINDVNVLGPAKLLMGSGDDLTTAANVNATRDLRVRGQAGADTLVMGDVDISRLASWNMGQGNDRVLVAGATRVDGRTLVRAGSGNDFVAFNPQSAGDTATSDDMFLVLGGGADNVLTDANTNVQRRVVVRGGSGADVYQNQSTNDDLRTFSVDMRPIDNFQTTIDAIFADLTAAGIDVSDFMGDGMTAAPVVTTSSGSVAFTEGDDPLIVDNGVTITDADSTELTGAVVEIADGFATGDLLAATASGGITVAPFDTATGQLRLTGTASLTAYQTVLRTVTFENASDAVGNDDRQITFEVMDAEDNLGDATRTVRVTDVNDPPTIATSGAVATYTEGDAPRVIDGQLTVADVDSVVLVGATVNITAGFQSGSDVLAFTAEAGISGTTEQNGQLLRFAGDATPATYQRLLRSVTFANSGDAPGTSRTFSFTVNDGSATASATATMTVVPVDDPGNLVLPAEFSGGNIPTRGVNVPFSFVATIEDADGTGDYLFQLDLEDSRIPTNANQPTIDANGVFTWTPSVSGRYEIRIIATNADGFTDQETFEIDIV